MKAIDDEEHDWGVIKIIMKDEDNNASLYAQNNFGLKGSDEFKILQSLKHIVGVKGL